jgi:hypothetical protein
MPPPHEVIPKTLPHETEMASSLKGRPMKSNLLQESPKTYALVFDKGDEVMTGLSEFAKRQRLSGSHIGFENDSAPNSPLVQSFTIPACAGSIRFKIRGLAGDSRSVEVSDSNPTDPFRKRSFSIADRQCREWSAIGGYPQIWF